MSITKSTRHTKVIGEFGEAILCNWLSRSGFEVAVIDHTGLDIVAYHPATKERLGITVKSRTRLSGSEKTSVTIFSNKRDEREVLIRACEAFACEPWLAVYVEMEKSAQLYLTSLKHYDCKYGKYRKPPPKNPDNWKMGKKWTKEYVEDPKVWHVSVSFERSKWGSDIPMNAGDLWKRYQQYLCTAPSIDLTLDISRIHFDDAFLQRMEPAMQRAFQAMDALEKGAIANPDEKRMVGHYWLRAPERAPKPEITKEIRDSVASIKAFAADVHSGKIKPPSAAKFTQVLSIGIGGSALGPEFVADALSQPGRDRMTMHFIDNTDPDGMARTMAVLEGKLKETLVLVMSKSGGTPEPHNGMTITAAAYKSAGLAFAPHAVAVTMPGSHLDKQAVAEKWLHRFVMFDWVGGRTSEMSAVGLVPGALQGIDVDTMLAGAAACDEVTRSHDTRRNPAALLALMWYSVTGGKGQKDMVVLPYKDRLLLFSRYLQQLVMESLGKRLDLDGKRVDQGISVYGNKGSTDQHAYVQQLRDGVNNFFVTFIRVLESGGAPVEVQPGVGAGDYLHGFLLGTRAALFDNERQSLTITVRRVDARTIGILIALFERAVGFYGSLVNINAYHQPGVEAGKKAAAAVLELQAKIVKALSPTPRTAEQIARDIGAADSAETVYLVLEHLAANKRAKIAQAADAGATTFAKL